MKNNILKVLFFMVFVALVVFNFKSNAKLNGCDIDLKQAQAWGMCEEYYGGVQVCCGPWSGSCLTGWGNFDGPYYTYP